MKTMCPPGCHHNGFVATHALGHMMYGIFFQNIQSIRFVIVAITVRSHCFHHNIYITLILLL